MGGGRWPPAIGCPWLPLWLALSRLRRLSLYGRVALFDSSQFGHWRHTIARILLPTLTSPNPNSACEKKPLLRLLSVSTLLPSYPPLSIFLCYFAPALYHL